MTDETTSEQPYTCDKCFKPVLPGEPVFGLMVNREARTTRHWKCHTPIEEVFSDLKKDLETLSTRVNRLRRNLRR